MAACVSYAYDSRIIRTYIIQEYPMYESNCACNCRGKTKFCVPSRDTSNRYASFQVKGQADGRIICRHWADIVL